MIYYASTDSTDIHMSVRVSVGVSNTKEQNQNCGFFTNLQLPNTFQ
jgi:hypothetical protein